MADTDDIWSANSNDAFAVSLVTPGLEGTRTIASFNPKFTYPIFGEEERIFGYQDLKINLRYHVSDMRPHMKISYSQKFKAIGETEAADLDTLLREFLPPVAFSKENDFTVAIKQVIPGQWKPLGECLAKFHSKDGSYEVWKASLADPAVQQMVKRIQILVLFFIEGGSYIPIDDQDPSLDRWTIFFLYQTQLVGDTSEPNRLSYHFAGYSTVYKFFPFQTPTPPLSPKKDTLQLATKEDLDFGDGKFSLSQLPCRTRISQFVIIPPFQGKGNGARLYSTIFKEYLEHLQTKEITVEDPNEAFDELRDLGDLTLLRTIFDFNELKINESVQIPRDGPAPKNIIDVAAAEALRRRVKIAPRQFSRVLEMNLMSKLPATVRPGVNLDDGEDHGKARVPVADQHKYRLWKLLVKQRLYRHNKDTLGQLEQSERSEKLSETLSSVEFEYACLLAKLERRNGGGVANGKRKMNEVGEQSSSKRVRVEDA